MRIARRPLLIGLTATLASAFGAGAVLPAATAATPPRPGQDFYVDPDSTPLQWAQDNPSDGRAEAIRTEIGGQPMARWFGNWSGPIDEATAAYTSAAEEEGQLPIMVAYNIAGRDACGGHSGGGAGSAEAYGTWIADFAGGVGGRPAVVILEPDSLGDYECMTDSEIEERQDMLIGAIDQFAAQAPNAWTYLDAGNAGWGTPETMAERLHEAGLEGAHGFSVNISNHLNTEASSAYAASINDVLQANYGYTKAFVVDTSRNANGDEDTDWCNPAGQQVGTISSWGDDAEMLLWIKTPGESDGDCGVGEGSSAGEFLPDVAYDQIFGA